MTGVAASMPMAESDQCNAFTAKPIRNGMLPSVRFSIGTLKHASIVQYLSESSRSRFRKLFTVRAPKRRAISRTRKPRVQDGAGVIRERGIVKRITPLYKTMTSALRPGASLC